MLKEHEIKERARLRAERKWKNADVRKRVKQRQEKPQLVDHKAKPEAGDVITNDGRRDGPVNRFESKFKCDLRTMILGYSEVNMAIHAMSIEHRRRILLREKLRRLKLKHNIGESND
jgi:hypothetical protein